MVKPMERMIAICFVEYPIMLARCSLMRDLAEERQASAELEALHRFSVFCLHDLKNLAARLSLGGSERRAPRQGSRVPGVRHEDGD